MSLRLSLDINGHTYRIIQPAYDIGIAMNFEGPQPSSYGIAPATSEPYRDGQWIGDVNQGGSCNFSVVRLTPHCNGTHTESVGHLANELVPVHKILTESLLPATLATILPETASDSNESYDPAPEDSDLLITRKKLETALENTDPAFLKALVIRTLPNPEEKRSWNYAERHSPYFSLEGMQYIHELGVEHLLVDIPSVDRLFDEGKLSNHRIFWQLSKEGHEVDLGNPYTRHRTITEFIYAPNEAADGHYLLDLQIAPFMADAAPSRPRLYEVE